MKKSEMIRNLGDFMHENKIYLVHYVPDVGYAPDSTGGAEKIIDFLLEKGMLPPTTKLSVINATDNGWDEED